jgi:hypothetical protein
MALPILDGNQSATTLSTILSSGQHITAHTVVSLGTQAITDIVNATSAGLTNTQLRASAVTVGGTVTVGNSVTVSSLPAISGTVTAGNLPIYIETDTISDGNVVGSIVFNVNGANAFGASGITVGSIPSLPAGTNRIGVVTIGAGTVTIGAGTAQIGSVTASISGTVPISGTVTVGNTVTIAGTVTANPTGTQTIAGTVTANLALLGGFAGAVQLVNYNEDDEQWYSIAVPNAGSPYIPTRIVGGTVTVGNSVTIGSLPALVAGTAQIGSVTASISGTVPISISSVTIGNSVTIASLPAISGTVTANTFALQGTAVTTSNFTSTTASTVLANFNAGREVLTIFNEGAGNLHICVGATCTTIAYQVRLSAGDYYEVPNHQTTITHSAVFATAGTARVTEVS